MSLIDEISQNFKKRFAAWVRIESRCRSNDISRGIQARIADPLWMLARQWQVGEFQGEDAGSPIEIELDYSTQGVDTFAVTDQTHSYDPEDIPLETLVERESQKVDWRNRVKLGQQVERSIRANLPDQAQDIITEYRTLFPLHIPQNEEWDALDYATQQFLSFMKNRVLDGKKLLRVYNKKMSPLADGTKNSLNIVLGNIAEQYKKICSQPASDSEKAWCSEKLNYRFKLNKPEREQESASLNIRPDVPGKFNIGQPYRPTDENDPATLKTQLIAPNYRNGNLDWYTVSLNGQVKNNWQQQEAIVRTPMRLRVGNTSLRWWALEDARTNFGDLDVAKPDLAKLALMEFTLIYGDDWYSVPIPVKMSNLVKIDNLTLSNVFGETEEIEPARKIEGGQDKRWDMYSICHYRNPDDVPDDAILFIPPSAGFREESDPLEEVHFLRDEGANMVWAIEKKVLNGLGQPIDGFDMQRERIERRDKVEIRKLQTEIFILQQQLNPNASFKYRIPHKYPNDEERVELENEIKEKTAKIEELERGPYAAEKPGNDAILRYRLATKVPENWFPFTPVNATRFFEPYTVPPPEYPPPSIYRLQRAQMLRNTDDEEPTSIPAFTNLLDNEADPLLWIDENTIGREGLRLLLTKQRVRWINGKTYVWLGRKVLIGRGEGSSGLRFDVIVPNKITN